MLQSYDVMHITWIILISCIIIFIYYIFTSQGQRDCATAGVTEKIPVVHMCLSHLRELIFFFFSGGFVCLFCDYDSVKLYL